MQSFTYTFVHTALFYYFTGEDLITLFKILNLDIWFFAHFKETTQDKVYYFLMYFAAQPLGFINLYENRDHLTPMKN